MHIPISLGEMQLPFVMSLLTTTSISRLTVFGVRLPTISLPSAPKSPGFSPTSTMARLLDCGRGPVAKLFENVAALAHQNQDRRAARRAFHFYSVSLYSPHDPVSVSRAHGSPRGLSSCLFRLGDGGQSYELLSFQARPRPRRRHRARVQGRYERDPSRRARGRARRLAGGD